MPPTDSELHLRAVFDVGPVEAGMAKMSAAVQTATEKTSQNFQQASKSVAATEQTMADSFAHLPVVASKAGAAGVLAFEEVKRRVIETTKEVASLRDEILHTNDSVKLGELQQQLSRARQEMTIARGELRGMRMEMTETREKADLLGDSMGIRIPGAIGRMLAQLPLLQTAMEAAFVPILILFAADAIEKMIDSIAEASRAWGGFGESARKAYQEALDFNTKMITASLELAAKQREVAAVGKEGAAKYAIEANNARQAALDQAAEVTRLNKELSKTNDEITELTKKTALGDKWLGTQGWVDYGEKLKETQETARRLKSELDPLEEKLRRRPPEIATKSAEETSRSAEEERAIATSVAEAKKAIATDYVNFYVSGLQQMHAAGQITFAEEIEGENAAAQQKLDIERAFVVSRKAILAQQTKETGKDNTPEMVALDKGLATTQIQTAETVRNNKIKLEQDTLRQQNEVNLATVQGAKTVADAEISATEQSARAQLAAKKIELEEENSLLKAAATQRIDEQKSVVTEQLRQANEFPDKNKALIIRLNAELIALEKDKTAKLEALNAEYQTRHLAELQREMEETLQFTETTSNRRLASELSTDDKRLSSHRITLAQWAALERDAIDRWFSEQSAALDTMLAKEKAIYGEDSLEYKKLNDKKVELDQERIAKLERVNQQILSSEAKTWQTIEQGFNSAVTSIVTGKDKVGKAFAQLWIQLIGDATQALLKVVEQFAIAELKMIVLHQAGTTQRSAQDNLWAGIEQALGIKTVAQKTAQDTQQSAAHTAALAQRKSADTIAATATQAQQLTEVTTYTTTEAAKTAAHETGIATRSAGDVTEAATRVATAVTSNIAIVMSEAGAAGAAGFASVMEALPFPINVATAPAVMAAAVATTLSNLTLASAAGGMDVQHDQILKAHEKEVVLPSPIAETFRSASKSLANRRDAASNFGAALPNESRTALSAAPGGIVPGGDSHSFAGNSSKSQASHTTHQSNIHAHFHSHGGGDPRKTFLGMEDELVGMIKKAKRRNKLD
jgi:hypothetical protein